MHKGTPLKSKLFDRGLLLVAAVVCAGLAWIFFNITGEHAFIFLLCAWFLISMNDAKKVKELQKENKALKEELEKGKSDTITSN